MIEIKSIRTIQKDYLNLLKNKLSSFTESNVTDKQLAYFFEEVSLFWQRRYEVLNFFLSKIEVDDKCSFLAGAMYVDLKNFGQYEFAPCGKVRIFTDPVTKMRNFFSNQATEVNKERAKEYLNKVVIDCVDVLSDYSEFFMVLPLDYIFSEDQEKRIKFLKDSSFSFISSLLVNQCATETEFIEKYQSIEEIEQDIKPELLEKLIFNDTNDISLSLKNRIEKNLDGILPIDSLRQTMSEAEIFLMAVGQFFMQAMDVILLACSYKLIPFIRSNVVFNYLLLIYPIFSEDEITVKLLEQTVVAYLFVKIYSEYDFSKIDFLNFNKTVGCNRLIDAVIEKWHLKGKRIFDLTVSELISAIKEECSQLLPI